MVIGEIIERVQKAFDLNLQNTNTKLSKRLVYNALLTARALLISQEIGKKHTISDWDLQSLTPVKLELVPEHENTGYTSFTRVLRSKKKIPRPVKSFFGDAIKRVRSIDRTSLEFSRVSSKGLSGLGGNKYGTENKYYIEGEYLYLYTKLNLKVVAIDAVFSDPLEVENFNRQEGLGESCFFALEQEFPMDSSKIDALVEIAVKELAIAAGGSQQKTQDNAEE